MIMTKEKGNVLKELEELKQKCVLIGKDEHPLICGQCFFNSGLATAWKIVEANMLSGDEWEMAKDNIDGFPVIGCYRDVLKEKLKKFTKEE